MATSCALPADRQPVRRILVINPNTNAAVTNLVRLAADGLDLPGTAVQVVNPASGPFSIESTADREAAVPHVIALIRDSRQEQYDACVLACFDDIALVEARALLAVPVIGTCEAGIAAARAQAHRFTIITTVHSAIPTIEGLLDRYDAKGICRVRAAGIGVAAAASTAGETQARIEQTIRLAVAEDGAEAILLASGGLTGRAGLLSERFGLPVIDGVMAAIEMAQRRLMGV